MLASLVWQANFSVSCTCLSFCFPFPSSHLFVCSFVRLFVCLFDVTLLSFLVVQLLGKLAAQPSLSLPLPKKATNASCPWQTKLQTIRTQDDDNNNIVSSLPPMGCHNSLPVAGSKQEVRPQLDKRALLLSGYIQFSWTRHKSRAEQSKANLACKVGEKSAQTRRKLTTLPIIHKLVVVSSPPEACRLKLADSSLPFGATPWQRRVKLVRQARNSIQLC